MKIKGGFSKGIKQSGGVQPSKPLQQKISGLEARLERLKDKFERADSPKARERLENRIEKRERRQERLERMLEARRPRPPEATEPAPGGAAGVEPLDVTGGWNTLDVFA